MGNQSQIYEFTIKLGEIRQEEVSVTNYYNSLKRLWQDLDLLNDSEWKSQEYYNHNKKMVEDYRIYKFLVGLNIEFDEVRGRLIGRQSLPSISEVFSEVRREESRRNVMLEKQGIFKPLEKSAMIALEASANKAMITNQRRQNEKPRAWCDYCNKPNYTRETC